MYGLLSIASHPALSASGWQTLRIGAGALIAELDVVPDVHTGADSLILRTDTAIAWKWDPNSTTYLGNDGSVGSWYPLFTPTNLPSPLAENAAVYYEGCYTVSQAPSNSDVIYAIHLKYNSAGPNSATRTCYKSTNGGTSWTELTGFPSISQSVSEVNGTSTRYLNKRSAVHPTDPNTCFIGFLGTQGLYCTQDGGSTWNKCTNLPNATGGDGVHGFVFNPANTNAGYVACGSDIYKSANLNLGASATFTKINSGINPTAVYNADITPAGKYYVVEIADGQAYSYNGSTWSLEAGGSSGCRAITCDPGSSTHVVIVGPNGEINEYNGSWSGPTNQTAQIYNDIPWIGVGSGGTLTLGANFSKVTTGKLYTNGQNDIFNITFTPGSIVGGTNKPWTSFGRGEEELVSNVIICPTTNKPAYGCWDFPQHYPNLTTYPTVAAGPRTGGNLSSTWHMDSAKFTNTDFIAAISDGSPYGSFGSQRSNFTTNYGSTFTLFGAGGTTLPSGVYTTGGGGHDGGCIAVSTPSNMIWSPCGGVVPQYTKNGGTTWANLSVTGVSNWSGLGFTDAITRGIWCVASPWAINTFYLYYPGTGFYKSTDSGDTWTQVTASPTSGFTKIYAVPGQTGHFWGFQAAAGGANIPNEFSPPSNALYSAPCLFYSSNDGATWTQVQNITQCFGGIGFGAVAPTQTYPSMYTRGWVTYSSTTSLTPAIGAGNHLTVPTGLSAVYTVDTPISIQKNTNGAHGTTATGKVVSYNSGTGDLNINITGIDTAGTETAWTVGAWGTWRNDTGESTNPPWTQIGAWPNSSYDIPNTICGDPGVYNQVYIGWNGSGAAVYKP